VVGVLVLAGCAAGPNDAVVPRPAGAGFWLGVWHGVIAPVAFVISLFSDRVGVYAVRNAGHWYDFGFLLGLGVLSSALGSARPGPARARRRRRRAV